MSVLARIGTALARMVPRVGGARGKRTGISGASWNAWATAQAEKLYGPHNPLAVGDRTLALMEADWTLGMCLELWQTAYHGTEYWVEGPSQELNAFVEEIWRREHRRWIRVLLGALPYGRATAEIVWELRDVAFEYVGPRQAKHKRTMRGSFVISDLRDYEPCQVKILVDERGDFAGVEVPEGVKLSADQVIHVVNDGRWGHLEGRSLFHRSYSPWWWCNVVYLGANRYLERKGDPPLIGYAPTEEEVDEQGNEQDPVKVTAVGAANLRGGGNFVLPSETDPESKLRRYELREMQVAQRAEEFLGLAQHYEALKALGALSHPGQVGAEREPFAGKKVGQRSQHKLFVERQHELILDPVNGCLVPRLVRANFGDVAERDMPRVCGGSLAENALDVLGELAQSAQRAVAVTADGRPVPVGSMIDWGRAFRALGVPTVDEDLIPDDLPTDNERPEPGQPRAIGTNPSRPEGPGERGLARRRPAAALGFARASTPEEWLAAAKAGLGRVDEVVERAGRAVEAERRRAERRIRGVLSAAVEQARTTETVDGREVMSTRNRALPAQVEAEVVAILNDSMDALLDETEISAEAFAGGAVSPLGAAHTEAAIAAGETVEAVGLKRPRGASAARAVRDIVRDAKTNGRGVATREGRRAREILDRLIQGGSTTEHAAKVAETWELPSRDLESSTVAHVRASARAILGADEVLQSDGVSWAALAGPTEEARVLDRFPQGKAADLLYRTWSSTADLDRHYESLVESGAVQTSWRNLGRTFGSPDMYVPVPHVLAAGVGALLRGKRGEWNDARRRRQEEIAAQERPAAEPAPSAPLAASRGPTVRAVVSHLAGVKQ